MKIKSITKIVSPKKDNTTSSHNEETDNILYVSGQNNINGDIIGYKEVVLSDSNVSIGSLYADHITIDEGAMVKASEIVGKQVYVNGELLANEATIDDLSLLEHSSVEGLFNIVNLESTVGAKIKAHISTYWQKPKHHATSSKVKANNDDRNHGDNEDKAKANNKRKIIRGNI